ncbi:MAG: hypothetical protein NC820_07465, partial [Candidatus Omnitrophica bacterium]|nr:hypothetical protein [Candidatus Omnitrophota bacterium]
KARNFWLTSILEWGLWNLFSIPVVLWFWSGNAYLLLAIPSAAIILSLNAFLSLYSILYLNYASISEETGIEKKLEELEGKIK